MSINPEEFRPKEKEKSDFYSWNLYRWLRRQNKEPEWAKKTRIYKSQEGELFIGVNYERTDQDMVSGVRLRYLCSGSGSKILPRLGCWSGSESWQDITDEFYAEYRKKGVCAIHGDFAHNFTVDGDTRTCNYCGKVEKKTIKIIEKVVWG